jgi:predicted dehydrogenase
MLKRTEIHGDRGTVIVEQDDVLTWQFERSTRHDAAVRRRFARRVGGGGGGASDPRAISYRGHYEQLRDLVRAVKTGGRPLVDGDEGRKSVEIILAIYKAAESGRAVGLPLARDPRFREHRPAPC